MRTEESGVEFIVSRDSQLLSLLVESCSLFVSVHFTDRYTSQDCTGLEYGGSSIVSFPIVSFPIVSFPDYRTKGALQFIVVLVTTIKNEI